MGVGLAFHVRFLDRAFVQSLDVVFSSRNSCKLFLRKQKSVPGGARDVRCAGLGQLTTTSIYVIRSRSLAVGPVKHRSRTNFVVFKYDDLFVCVAYPVHRAVEGALCDRLDHLEVLSRMASIQSAPIPICIQLLGATLSVRRENTEINPTNTLLLASSMLHIHWLSTSMTTLKEAILRESFTERTCGMLIL